MIKHGVLNQQRAFHRLSLFPSEIVVPIFLAHLLLCRIYPDNIKLKFALNCMARISDNQDRVLTSSQYEIIKIGVHDNK